MEYPVGGESSTCSFTCDSTPEWEYDVFLTFTGHLDYAFNRSGIKTFRDDVDLERGGVIKDDIFQAIEDSFCAVLVMSENYAISTWCLDELQKILECRNKLGRRVFPIFYDVDPADVRHQRSSFWKSLG
ncbi:TMV resistance protein N-like [Prosopis cineraria]|uniref:TMV resistance protein N-like n=1 Tax=Prosopis cineraria TaxID=364024 RepID=UPI00240F30A8|nr:TMV resistance protein N-like [Prosopis cineraria]